MPAVADGPNHCSSSRGVATRLRLRIGLPDFNAGGLGAVGTHRDQQLRPAAKVVAGNFRGWSCLGPLPRQREPQQPAEQTPLARQLGQASADLSRGRDGVEDARRRR